MQAVIQTIEDFIAACEDEPFRLVMRLEPVSKGRPRVGKGGGHVYTPEATREFEARVRYAAMALNVPPVAYPVKVTLSFSLTVPRSYKGLQRDAALAGYINPPRGDLDNKVKAVTDALNGVAYLDDCQIIRFAVSQTYAVEPRIEVHIQRAGVSLYELQKLRDERANVNTGGRSPTVGQEGRSGISLRAEQAPVNGKRAP